MIRCQTCLNENLNSSRYCDECGTRLAPGLNENDSLPPLYVPPPSAQVLSARPAPVTSFEIPPIGVEADANKNTIESGTDKPGIAHATLVIERGDSPGTEFRLTGHESIIGRWDADNGVFPDVDLDAFDHDAKVSRRHARIRRNNGAYVIEDLGSTNGTYVNRGRRLIPGNAEILSDGDEVIVGKTFLRFQITH